MRGLGGLGKVHSFFWSGALKVSRLVCLSLSLVIPFNLIAESSPEVMEEVVVTAASSIHQRLGTVGSASVILGEAID